MEGPAAGMCLAEVSAPMDESPPPPELEPGPEPAAAPAPVPVPVENTTRVEHDIALSAIFKILGALLGLWLLSRIWPAVVLLAFAVMLAATFNPLVRRLELRLKRAGALAAVIAGIAGLGALLIGVLIPPLVRQGRSLLVHLPDYASAVDAAAAQRHLPFRLSALARNWTEQAAAVGPQVLNLLGTVVSGVLEGVTVVVLTIYLLVDGPHVTAALIRLLPRPERLPVRNLFARLTEQVGAYIRTQLLISTMAGVFSFCLLLIFRVPEPLALAFLIGVSDVVPVFGVAIGAGTAALMALTRGVLTALVVAGAYLIYHQIENNVVVPRFYASRMNLRPSIVLIAILMGATLMGIPGMLLALPVAAAVPVLVRFIGEWHDRQVERNSRLP